VSIATTDVSSSFAQSFEEVNAELKYFPCGSQDLHDIFFISKILLYFASYANYLSKVHGLQRTGSPVVSVPICAALVWMLPKEAVGGQHSTALACGW